jgi:glycosyltransferase involved in cell wall biosynthesis
VRDIFGEGEGGRYFTANDPDALARLLCSIDAERGQLATLSSAALRNVEGRFEVDAIAREFAEVLSEAATMRVRGGGLLACALRPRVPHRPGEPIVSPP